MLRVNARSQQGRRTGRGAAMGRARAVGSACRLLRSARPTTGRCTATRASVSCTPHSGAKWARLLDGLQADQNFAWCPSQHINRPACRKRLPRQSPRPGRGLARVRRCGFAGYIKRVAQTMRLAAAPNTAARAGPPAAAVADASPAGSSSTLWPVLTCCLPVVSFLQSILLEHLSEPQAAAVQSISAILADLRVRTPT